MSKEIQCKCCKEYWWEMNIHSKCGLCPNCYDYVADIEAKLAEKDEEIAELQKQLEEKDKLIERLQGVIDKLRDKKFAGKTLVEAVNAVYEPLFKNKCDEVEEFKQQLHELPKKIVEDIKDKIPEIARMKRAIIIDDYLKLNTLLDTILKKYLEQAENQINKRSSNDA